MQGKILNIWMSPDTGKKSHYGARTLGGIFGIAALTLLLISGGAVLTLSMGRHSAALWKKREWNMFPWFPSICPASKPTRASIWTRIC